MALEVFLHGMFFVGIVWRFGFFALKSLFSIQAYVDSIGKKSAWWRERTYS